MVVIALLLAPKQVPAAAVTRIFNLICRSSIATVACIWYIRVSCQCNFLHLPFSGVVIDGFTWVYHFLLPR